jgi:hypothetical protein
MKRLLFVLLLVFSAYGVDAATNWNPDWGCSVDGSGCEGWEGFESEGGGGTGGNKDEYTLGHNYNQCTASSLYGQHCYGCTWNRYGKLICATVDTTASCMCEQKRTNQDRPGITECIPNGSCTYEQW